MTLTDSDHQKITSIFKYIWKGRNYGLQI